jgi:membrane protein
VNDDPHPDRRGDGAPPRQPRLSQLKLATWRGVLARSARGFKQDNCLDLAAALTYWSLLALFPAAIVVVALAGLVATSEAAVNTLVEIFEELAPDEAAAALTDRLRDVAGQRTAAGVLFSFGLLGALWTAGAYLRSFTRAANIIYAVPESRPFYRLLPQQLLLTVVSLVLAAVVVFGLIVSGPVAEAVGNALGLGQSVLVVWNTAKWPLLVLLAGTLLSLLFWIAPNVRQPRFRWLTVGGAVALLVWVLVSVGFGFYVANFGAYDATYGTLGAVIVFLVWLFLTNCAILLGVEINAELQRGRRLQAGQAVDSDGPILPPRVPT